MDTRDLAIAPMPLRSFSRDEVSTRYGGRPSGWTVAAVPEPSPR